MEKILPDTDIGGDIDDAICLAYLLKEPRCDLLGITTVCGEPEKRAAVADAICRAAGRLPQMGEPPARFFCAIRSSRRSRACRGG